MTTPVAPAPNAPPSPAVASGWHYLVLFFAVVAAIVCSFTGWPENDARSVLTVVTALAAVLIMGHDLGSKDRDATSTDVAAVALAVLVVGLATKDLRPLADSLLYGLFALPLVGAATFLAVRARKQNGTAVRQNFLAWLHLIAAASLATLMLIAVVC